MQATEVSLLEFIAVPIPRVTEVAFVRNHLRLLTQSLGCELQQFARRDLLRRAFPDRPIRRWRTPPARRVRQCDFDLLETLRRRHISGSRPGDAAKKEKAAKESEGKAHGTEGNEKHSPPVPQSRHRRGATHERG